MAKMIPNNGNETKIEFFPRDILTLFTIVRKILTYLNDFQLKSNKITREMCKSASIFRYLQSTILFEF